MAGLYVGQEENGGYLSKEAMRDVAEVMDLTPADVESVASFYSMYNKRPVGKYLIEVCTNISCSLLGAEKLAGPGEERLGGPTGGKTPDGLFTWKCVGGRASCGVAPR